MRKVYLDHAATTPLAPEVLEAMKPYFWEKFGNASSLHSWGQEAREAVETARLGIARELGAKESEIIFTSGGTESDNLAVLGAARALRKKGNHVITSAFEHHAVLHPCQLLEKQGFEVTYINPEKNGLINQEKVRAAVKPSTSLISIMHANNEIGTIQPLEEIGKIAKEKGILFHTDAVQTVGKLEVNVEKLGVGLLSLSAHKFYGPKGIGALYVRGGVRLEPLVSGGGHEFGLRSGTENVPGIVGCAEALKLANKNREKEEARLLKLREKLVDGILEQVPGSWLNGDRKMRMAGNANFGFPYIEGESLVLKLDEKGIAASTGSACSMHDLKPSHVLTSIGLRPEQAHGSLRLTLGHGNSEEDINYVLGTLPPIVKELTEMSPLTRKR